MTTDPLDIVEVSGATLSRVCRGKIPGCPDQCFHVLHIGDPVSQTAVLELIYEDGLSWKYLGTFPKNVPAIEAVEKLLGARGER